MDAHLFICTNKKELGGCCASKGSAQLKDQTKKIASEALLAEKGRFRVNASGCLGRCSEGITAVLYPQGKWFTGLKANAAPILVEELKKALKT